MRKCANGNCRVAKLEAKNNDFAWDVPEKMKIEGVRGRNCGGKAAVSCERGAKKRYNNKSAKSGAVVLLRRNEHSGQNLREALRLC